VTTPRLRDAGAGPDTDPDRLGPCRILVVEDEAMVAMLVEDQLLEAGANVLGPVASLAAALALLDQAEGCDAAVLDVNLRGESVVPLADALARRGVPFLFMTGYGNADGLGSHARVPVLAKPFEPLELVVVLARLLRQAKAAG
jgi:DNA-binding response OmpR family regulator